MQQASSWKELLKLIISDPTERERIASKMSVNPVTLVRWASDDAKPRPQNLRRLLKALPRQYQDEFQELLEKDLSFRSLTEIDNSLSEKDDSQQKIFSPLFSEVLDSRANGPDNLRFWTITRQVLQHALRQLDPEPVGMAITVVCCLPPTPDGKIRSLRESVGLGNAPWESDLEAKALFLGAESLAGYVVTVGHFEHIPDLNIEKSFLPAYQTEYEVSAAACPVKYAGRVAGCLLLSSTKPNYFLSQTRQSLIQDYTNLLALAFEPEEFYPLDLIELVLMPSLEVQRPYFANLRQRIIQILRESTQTSQPLSITRAELVAWQQIEEILLHLPPRITGSPS